MKPTLVILAAGIGSRYGGLKQMEPVGPSGEFLVDYAVYDAIRAGFERMVFVIRNEMADEFDDTIVSGWKNRVEVECVCQQLGAVPPGFDVPAGRRKPWGTGHALLTCADVVGRPFGVINADDFYGCRSYEVLAGFLTKTSTEETSYAMVAFVLANTLSAHGTVARGICRVGADGRLAGVEEKTALAADNLGTSGLDGSEPVSLNMWGFKPSLFTHLSSRFRRFLQGSAESTSDEFFLPDVINELVKEDLATVEVLSSPDSWLGITNRADRDGVVAGIRALVSAGVYPETLHG